VLSGRTKLCAAATSSRWQIRDGREKKKWLRAEVEERQRSEVLSDFCCFGEEEEKGELRRKEFTRAEECSEEPSAA
jgi:hypothetical protein